VIFVLGASAAFYLGHRHLNIWVVDHDDSALCFQHRALAYSSLLAISKRLRQRLCCAVCGSNAGMKDYNVTAELAYR